MKRLTFTYVFLFLVFAVSLSVHAVTPVSTTDGGGNADTLEGQNGPFYLDAGNSTGTLPPSSFDNISATTVHTTGDILADGFIDGKKSFGSLVDDNIGLGTAYNLTTSFQTYTSYTTTLSSSDITLSASNGTVTIGVDSGGEYNIQADISVTAVGGVELEFALFRNLTTELGTFIRGVEGVHHHPPVLINLTSDTGGAAYNTFSSIENLSFADSNDIWIDEATSGTHPILFDMTFNDEVLYPTAVEFISVLYDGATAHEVEALIWNYSTTAWVGMRSDVKDFPDAAGTDPFRYYDREFEVPSPISSYVDVALNEAKVRMDHTSTGNPGHQIRIDKVQLHDSHASAAISITNIFTVPGGSVLSIKIKSDKILPAYFANVHFHVTKVSN